MAVKNYTRLVHITANHKKDQFQKNVLHTIGFLWIKKFFSDQFC